MTRGENGEYTMRLGIGILLFFLLPISALSQTPCQPTGFGVCRYVSTTGSDSNNGLTRATPKQTIQTTINASNPGDEIIVLNGTYNCATQPAIRSCTCGIPDSCTTKLIQITTSGTAANPIVVTCDTYLGCKIDGTNNTTDEAFVLDASYITVKNFEIEGFIDKGFDNCCAGGGSHLVYSRNWIHDIGHYCTNTGIGRDGIFVNWTDITITQNIISDIGRYAIGENGCNSSLPENDHGIYVSGGGGPVDSVLISNNIIYRDERGCSIQLYPGTLSNISILNNTFIYADLLSGSSQGQIVVGYLTSGTNILIKNNISYQPGNYFVWLGNSSEPVTGTIANNIIYGTSNVTSPNPGGVNFIITGNLVSTDPKLLNVGTSTMDALPSTPDAHLTAGSPAINAGLTLAMVPDDFAGTARIPGAYDIGAYANPHVSSVAPPTNLRAVVH